MGYYFPASIHPVVRTVLTRASLIGSKHAVEGIAESLAKEVHPPWNIKVTIIEFGAFKTRAGESITVVPEHPAYDKPDSTLKFMRGFLAQAGADSYIATWRRPRVNCAR